MYRRGPGWQRRRSAPAKRGRAEPSFRPGCRPLVVGQAVNAVGSWAAAIAIWGFAAHRFHPGRLGVAALTLCWAAPPAMFAPFLGVPIDRVGPRRALLVGYLAAAISALTKGSATFLGQLDLLAIGYGLCRAVNSPAAAALPPSLVGEEQLVSANAVLSGATSSVQVLGL
ncbi:MAG: MFS transporter [Mycobacteriales bacterium]